MQHKTATTLSLLSLVAGISVASPHPKRHARSAASSPRASPTPARSGNSSAAGGTAPGVVGATAKTTAGSGPNGAESWFNMGIDAGAGWTPPHLDLSAAIHISKDAFYAGAGSPCAQFDQYFSVSGPKYNVDPMIVAAIAMQESSCNPQAPNGDGPAGLMQVACENYPDKSCAGKSVADNVDAGAKYLRGQLDQYQNNIISALGGYNGWFTADSPQDGGKGLTKDYPCSPQGRSSGGPQNLDYIQEILNGWFQGLDVYSGAGNIGTYQCSSCKNGNVC